MEFLVHKAITVIRELKVYNEQKFSMELESGVRDNLKTLIGVKYLNNGNPIEETADIKKYVFLKYHQYSYEDLENIFKTIKLLCPTFSYNVNDFTNNDIEREIVNLNELYSSFEKV